MAFKLYQFLKNNLRLTPFLLKLTQFDKTGSIDKILNPLGNLNIKIDFQKRNRSRLKSTFEIKIFP